MSGGARKLFTINMWPVLVYFLVGLHCVNVSPIPREEHSVNSRQDMNTEYILENAIPNEVKSKAENMESDQSQIQENSETNQVRNAKPYTKNSTREDVDSEINHQERDKGHILEKATSQYVDSETPQQERAKREIPEDMREYLMNFGYLPEKDAHSGQLMSEDVIKNALMEMQAFAHLPVTGEMDSATETLMHTPRCGLPDKGAQTARRKRYLLQGAKWLKKDVTWSLRGRSWGNVDRERVRRTVYEALQVWQSNSGLRFQERREDDDADILVSFARREHDSDTYRFDGPGMVLAHAFPPGDGIGGDAHFDEDETWKVDAGHEGVSLFATAVHELGHSLGLLHSDRLEAIMYPYLNHNLHLSHLPEDDRRAIQAIYGANQGASRDNVDRRTQEYPNNPRGNPRPPDTTRRPQRPPIVTSPEHKPPETCVHDFDAIFMFREDLYIFKDVYVWRFRNSMIVDGFPTKTTLFWNALPEVTERIDAAYENPSGEVVFFSGRHFYVVGTGDASHTMTLTRSGRLSDLGLPDRLEKLDGAMVFPGDGTTYFFAGELFWQYDEATGRTSARPKRIETGWRGVQKDVDAVVPWSDGKTYFFKDKGYWKYGAEKVGSPQELAAPLLMMCTTGTKTDKGTGTNAGDRVSGHDTLVYVLLALLLVVKCSTT